jgi:Coenzyme PQQ synthesis protein D (PqqD)
MRYQRKSSVECAPMNDETILYDPGTVRFCLLNGTAAYLWERLETPRSADELLGDITHGYVDVDPGTARHDVQAVLTELVQLAFVASNVEAERPGSNPTAPDGPDDESGGEQRSAYGQPTIRVMDESEVLAAFQVTSAGITWWMM